MTMQGKTKIAVEIDQDFEQAADDAGYFLGHAANIFSAISDGLSGGYLSGREGCLVSLSEVCARAFGSVARDEGERLSEVATAIRNHRARAARDADQKASLLKQSEEAAARGRSDVAAYLRGGATG